MVSGLRASTRYSHYPLVGASPGIQDLAICVLLLRCESKKERPVTLASNGRFFVLTIWFLAIGNQGNG